MGAIEKILSKCELLERDDHNSRVFVDCNENIHVHWREFRWIFSVEEYKQFSAAIIESVDNLEKELKLGYKEDPELAQAPVKILGGSQTEKLKLPNPKRSKYLNNNFTIELQKKSYGDKIHWHWRDFRIVIRKWETWKMLCETVAEAWKNTKREWFDE